MKILRAQFDSLIISTNNSVSSSNVESNSTQPVKSSELMFEILVELGSCRETVRNALERLIFARGQSVRSKKDSKLYRIVDLWSTQD